MTASFAVDRTALATPQYSSTRKPGSWLMRDMPLAKPRVLDSLEAGVEARIVVERNGRNEIWVGRVVMRRRTSVLLRLWGSGKLWPVTLAMVLRAGVVPAHSFVEYEAACRLQRQGEPAGLEVPKKRTAAAHQGRIIELGDTAVRQVEDFATARKISLEEASERLISLGIRRLTALRKWEQKRHDGRPCSSPTTKLG